MKRLNVPTTMLLLAATTASAVAAPPAKRSAPKPAAAGVKGTAQLPGDVGQIGVTYTLTPSGYRPLNLTINRLSYVASRMTLAGTTLWPDTADQKFLVIDFTVQNPNSDGPMNISRGFVTFTAVDAVGQNHNWNDRLEDTETHQNLSIALKPGQKVVGRGYIDVPAAGETPKLMLDWGAAGKRVMRFDLHGKVAPVEAVLRDPADASGATARAVIPDAKIGVTYPTAMFDVTVEKFEINPGPLADGRKPDQGKVYLVTTLRARNVMNEDRDFTNGNRMTADVLDADGDKYERDSDLYKGSTDARAEAAVPVGVEKTFRILTEVPKGDALKTLTLALGSKERKLVYDLAGIK